MENKESYRKFWAYSSSHKDGSFAFPEVPQSFFSFLLWLVTVYARGWKSLVVQKVVERICTPSGFHKDKGERIFDWK